MLFATISVFSPGGGPGVQGVVGPMVFGIASLEAFLDFMIAALPETGQVLGHLHRAAGR